MADKRKFAELNRPATLLVTPPETYISLNRDEFKALEARFEAEGDYRWLKYDYFPQLAKFVLRMPGTVHEAVIGAFERLVIRQLHIIEQSNDRVAADFTRDESEAFEQTLKRRRGSDEVLEGRSRQRMVKQKLVRPSQEKLESSDEKRFEAMEEEAEKQLSGQEQDYILELD
ncbi:hypothetical protein B0T26DRAFT_675473 [Lasiosphaeria miniovina]|uniref:Uncharacterized protein n=1 Tax=Lasiosphaeria miniovina TaxID=1954250 RepID=A0AA40DXC6_9PEZI|nr:uncharacterized protein B0T26DRAFT_675473 [Lasiosphaeria miniovina]KAK0717112.1 hypothetical protein B0T26DRAFT_675473 [Lasiosphaeria miniovina]